LRNHPSLALWCGNNESDEGWHNWGWQKQYSYTLSDSSEIWHAYQSLFHQLLPNLISSLDAGRYYHPSSPANGWGRAKAYKTGDVHYWGVWWGDEPFTKYDEKVGRFVSEYGFQGFPSLDLLKKWVPLSGLHLDSAALKAHQKHPRGFELIRSQLAREGFLATDSLILFAQHSAKLQAMGMERAIDAHRRNMPYCMGSLFWQWNDCWPAISWSAIDFEGTPKPVYEAIQRAFKPIRQQAFLANGHWKFGIISDRHDTVKLKVKLTIHNDSGETLVNGSWDIALTWGFNEQVFFEPDLLTKLDFSEPCLLTIQLMEAKQNIDQKTYTFRRKSALDPIEILNLYHDN
jgi:beta-mannosidase